MHLSGVSNEKKNPLYQVTNVVVERESLTGVPEIEDAIVCGETENDEMSQYMGQSFKDSIFEKGASVYEKGESIYEKGESVYEKNSF